MSFVTGWAVELAARFRAIASLPLLAIVLVADDVNRKEGRQAETMNLSLNMGTCLDYTPSPMLGAALSK